MLAKKGSSYEHVEVNDEILQNCNRVFATKNGGVIYKVKANGRKDKVPNTSEKSEVWNESKYDTINLDKNYYYHFIQAEINNF
jgi:hypothetical protein